MNKIVKRILLIGGIIILLIIVLVAGYMLKFKSEIKAMCPVETGQVIDSVFALRDSFVNMFLIKDGEHYIAIDGANDVGIIKEELGKLNISPVQIVAVFLTHTDGDHVAVLKLLKNAKVYISRQEEQMINGKKSRFLVFNNTIYNKQYFLVDDRQTIKICNTELMGILTPGHTPGTMCWLVNNKYLFTGDALGLKNGTVIRFNSFANMDSESAAKSINIIAKLPEPEYLFTAHYGYSSDFKNAVKDWEKK